MESAFRTIKVHAERAAESHEDLQEEIKLLKAANDELRQATVSLASGYIAQRLKSIEQRLEKQALEIRSCLESLQHVASDTERVERETKTSLKMMSNQLDYHLGLKPKEASK